MVGMARDICISLGKRILNLRKARGWRQIDLAEQAGINENYVSDLEHGRKEICIRTLQTVAQAFGIKTSELLADID
jgi:XRE family aerobic/anaerobic benzoate catabolism transcriptional regulator